MDLNGAKLTSSLIEMQSRSNKTIVKVLTVGMVLSIAVGIISVICYIFSELQGVASFEMLSSVIKPIYAYLLPAGISAVYFAVALFYYMFRIEKSLEGLEV